MRLTGGPPDCWASGSTLLTTLLQCHCVVLYSVHNISVGFHLRSYILSTSPHEYACSILYIPAIRDLHSWLLQLHPPPASPLHPSPPPLLLLHYSLFRPIFPPIASDPSPPSPTGSGFISFRSGLMCVWPIQRKRGLWFRVPLPNIIRGVISLSLTDRALLSV